MSYQICPLCGGSGMTGAYGHPCEVCNGKRIINEINGKPPEDKVSSKFKESK